MKKASQLTIFLCLIVILSACSSFKFPGVYRLSVQQGNYIERDMVDQLKKGMTKRQVQYVMGTPLLKDPFNADRWDYYFDIKRGEKQYRENHFTVFFENEQLVRWEGTYENEVRSSDLDTRKPPKTAEEDIQDLQRDKFKKIETPENTKEEKE